MVKETHLYDILEVSTAASTEEISKNYKRRALKCHPDKTNHDPQLTEQFKEMTRAYEVLRDPNQRTIYDQYGEEGLSGVVVDEPQQAPAAAAAPPPVPPRRRSAFATDIFSQVFNDINSMFSQGPMFEFSATSAPGSGHPFMSTTTSTSTIFDGTQFSSSASGSFENMKKIVEPWGEQEFMRGEDIHHTCTVNLADLVYGKTIKLQLPKNSKCGVCQGNGGFNPKTCIQCRGTGKIKTTFCNRFSRFQQTGSCKPCNGTGIFTHYKDKCPNCKATGYIQQSKLIKVNVYPGSKDGDRIILPSEGDEGRNIIPGDLIIHLRQNRHPFLVRKGHDLFMDHEIDLKTALLGGEIQIPNFIKQGQLLKVYINVHGIESVNNNDSIQQGEIVGVINSDEPKILKGLGMPINEMVKGGEIIENLNEVEEMKEVLFDLRRYNRGNLYINFHVKLPNIGDFSQMDLLQLQSILPSAQPTGENGSEIIESNLANLPGNPRIYKSVSPTKSSSGDIDMDINGGSYVNGKRRRF
ncbi:uncharacterized protein SPAPADRAFT_59248 [Spathaspora passalidarum NRRL Y-27907]|uniref:Uncharacterized protein n=1 Tax=Spathaspora passalidarum (strain NRRL Y-27907 / 11-Y1) TaxID=619300 RepID=G3AJH0_SPAPN|nr:uncharacterized protein SPAPADRAFT_59248 [Spathaspora passalidarum NRRL Y-27907]EGW33873.1 hypothetical protein SPAPADRAFT_59248 [Spathaspora passalidarum NRRL Y-27907]